MKEIHLRVEDDLHKQLKAFAKQRGEPMAVVVRRLLRSALANQAAVDAVDVVSVAVRKVIRAELKPTENRMAKLAAKAAIAAATAMYLNTQTIEDLGKRDALDLYRRARVKAVAYLRASDDDTKEGE
ncbi:MAG: hypothetical protein H0Z39_08775 [Peptococcaceae bacterium]|nr:hypothetical protein [Peptococcaceae bacterium]